MSNFITTADYDASIHAEILDQLLRKESPSYDPQIVEICEDRAIAEMRSYLDKIYDCDKIFSATGSDRHPLILMFALDITIYHIFCQHNPYKMSKIRQDRYDRAIEWLKGGYERRRDHRWGTTATRRQPRVQFTMANQRL